MRVRQYIEAFMDNLDNLIFSLHDEMEQLAATRRIATINGMHALFLELDKKYRLIAVELDFDEDLFEDYIRGYDPQIFRPYGHRMLAYVPIVHEVK